MSIKKMNRKAGSPSEARREIETTNIIIACIQIPDTRK
jgi:hypothetical protein